MDYLKSKSYIMLYFIEQRTEQLNDNKILYCLFHKCQITNLLLLLILVNHGYIFFLITTNTI